MDALGRGGAVCGAVDTVRRYAFLLLGVCGLALPTGAQIFNPGSSGGGGAGGPTTLTGAVTGSGTGTVPTTLTPAAVQAAVGPYVVAKPAVVLKLVAASNSVNSAGADFVATGTNDQTIINNAIAACPSATSGQAGPVNCVIQLQPGVYNISAPIVVDNDDVTIQGAGHCMWGGYLGVWSGTSSPAGTVGTGCSQIKASASGFNLIEVQHNNLSGNGYSGTGGDQQRHRGLMFKSLYLVGNGFTGTAIKSICGTNAGCKTITTNGVTSTGYSDDNCFVIDNVIENVADGVNVVWDTADIEQNSIQSIAGNGLVVTDSFGRITNNLIFDIGGSGIVSSTDGAVISNNIIGSTNAYGIYATKQFSITGNQFFITRTGAIRVISGSNATITANVVNYPGGYGGSPTGDAVSIDSASTNIAVTGNSLYTSASIAGYAINDLGGYGAVSGNSIVGQWNSGGVAVSLAATNQTIQDSGSAPFYTFINGTTPGIRYYSQDSATSGTKPFLAMVDGATNGFYLQTYGGAYSKATLGFNGSNGGAVDFGSYRSVQSDGSGNILLNTANVAGNGTLQRLSISGGTTATIGVSSSNVVLNTPGTYLSAPFSETSIGAAVASASTIAPSGQTFHVTGTTAITTLSPPSGYSTTVGGPVTLIADGAWTLSAGTGTGQFKSALTAVAGVAYVCSFDGTLWYCK